MILGNLVVIIKNKLVFISHMLYNGRFQLEGRCKYKKNHRNSKTKHEIIFITWTSKGPCNYGPKH